MIVDAIKERAYLFDFRINIQLLNGNVVAISIIHSRKWQLILVLCFRWHETTLRAPFQFIECQIFRSHIIFALSHIFISFVVRAPLFLLSFSCSPPSLSLSSIPGDYSNLVRLHSRIRSSDTKLKLLLNGSAAKLDLFSARFLVHYFSAYCIRCFYEVDR